MKALFLCLLSLLPLNSYAQYTLSGLITYQNSDHTPVEGAMVKARFNNRTETDSKGGFSLSLVGKQPGYQVFLTVDKTDYEIVNKKDLKYTLKADRKRRIKLYMCPVGQWERNALSYYEINEKVITRGYQERVDNARKALADRQQVLSDSLAKLAEQYEIVLHQAKDLAQRFAKANLDDASELYIKAFEFFKRGEIDSAIAVLEDDLLDQQMADAQRDKQHGTELKEQGTLRDSLAHIAGLTLAEDYALKADLLLQQTPIDWKAVFVAYQEAIHLAPYEVAYREKYAQALKQAADAQALPSKALDSFLQDSFVQHSLERFFPYPTPSTSFYASHVIPALEKQYRQFPERLEFQQYLSHYYHSEAKQQLYAQKFAKAESLAHKGLSFTPKDLALNLLLAHALLFQDQYEGAATLYLQFTHQRQHIFQAWQDLEALGLTHPKQRKLRKALMK